MFQVIELVQKCLEGRSGKGKMTHARRAERGSLQIRFGITRALARNLAAVPGKVYNLDK